IQLMEADASKLTIHSSYNLNGISFSPEQLAAAIKKHIPEFKITYQSDFRQAIADSWPQSIDDSVAVKDWGWRPDYDLEKMTDIMISEIMKKIPKTVNS
ncbi:MAG: NAD-dependent epimerase, partial [Bacteroidota bacterium]|nr:NAD-dependent epimerase [Bacteroidota bacterium]